MLFYNVFSSVPYIDILRSQRIDLRDNSIQMRGVQALVNVMKRNKNITQIDLDDKPRIRIVSPTHLLIREVFIV